jgi:hypothetical protein
MVAVPGVAAFDLSREISITMPPWGTETETNMTWRNCKSKFTDFTHLISIYKIQPAFTSTRTVRSLSSPAQFLALAATHRRTDSTLQSASGFDREVPTHALSQIPGKHQEADNITRNDRKWLV